MGHALDLKFLQLVVAIAEEGSLTRAGKRLHLTQSALSHQLATLETRFGVEIFVRKGRQLRLTPLGDRLVSRARLLVSQVEALEAELLSPQRQKQELRIVTQCFTCYHWLPSLLCVFEAEHPRTTVSLVVESTRHALDALDAGAVDLAISTEQREDARYLRQHVFDDELMIALSPRHRLAEGSEVLCSDLQDERLLVHPPSDADRRWFQHSMNCGGAAFEPREVQRIPVTDSIVELAASGYGCALMSRRAASHAVAQGRIVLRQLGPRPLIRSFFAYRRHDNPTQLPIDDFIGVLVQHCRDETFAP